MPPAAFFITLLIPLIVQGIVWLFLKLGKLKKYSKSELEAMRNINFPSSYKLLYNLSLIFQMIMIILLAGAGVIFYKSTQNPELVSAYFRPLLAPDSIFLNPSPADVFIGFVGFFIIFFGGLSLLVNLYVFLPSHFKAFVILQGSQNKNIFANITDESAQTAINKLIGALSVILLLGIIGILPFFQAVNSTSISRLASYPFHVQVPLSEITHLEVTCNTPGRKSEQVNIEITAYTNRDKITLFAPSDALNYIPVSDIHGLYELMKQHNIPVKQSIEPLCSELVPKVTDIQQQYEALFLQ